MMDLARGGNTHLRVISLAFEFILVACSLPDTSPIHITAFFLSQILTLAAEREHERENTFT
jgi:hypothetical protein